MQYIRLPVKSTINVKNDMEERPIDHSALVLKIIIIVQLTQQSSLTKINLWLNITEKDILYTQVLRNLS